MKLWSSDRKRWSTTPPRFGHSAVHPTITDHYEITSRFSQSILAVLAFWRVSTGLRVEHGPTSKWKIGIWRLSSLLSNLLSLSFGHPTPSNTKLVRMITRSSRYHCDCPGFQDHSQLDGFNMLQPPVTIEVCIIPSVGWRSKHPTVVSEGKGGWES